ncbi:MAG: GxxExxY protein [Mariniphaga sp.]|jgi:GxxExxY protein|nr:GxxExxY protein [Mariniphaga sp.]
MEKLNQITYEIIGAAYKVHSTLGPGLLESAYEVCLEYELLKKGFKVERQKPLPVIYEDVKLDAGYRIDLLVEDDVIVELKAVEEIAPIHQAQIMTYLKLSDRKLGLLMNFNVTNMKKGIKRIIM